MPVCAACGRENPEGARFCNACAAPLEAAPPRETRKTVAVLFCDVTGYTATGDRLDPEALRRLQSRYFDESRATLERHGATVEKFIGDAVMAVFGIPQLHEDDSLRAVRAGVELRDAVAALGLQARIGVNTGEVVAGSGDALVTGDAVNVAARLEQAAQPGEILVGEATHRLVRDAVDAEPVSVEAKGKEEAVAARRLRAVLPGAAYERRLDSPMVGRERERALLRQAFERTVGYRACHLFTVLGAAGVGKSRLVAEFLADVDARIVRGRCLSYGEGITYWPLHEVLEELGDGEQGRPVRDLLGGAASSPDDLFFAVRKLLEGLAGDRPLVVVFDDVHWAEPTFLDLVDNVTDWSRDAPIVLLCLARPELLDERPGWGGGKLNATSVLLEPLSDEEAGRLIGNLLGNAELAENVRRRIADAAEGNPLFVEEMLEMLIDDGLLERRNGSWVATGDLSAVAVPPTIQALLAARLDRLRDEERVVIERAAVEGKVFHRGAVAELAPEALRPSVPTHLMALVRKELVRPDRAELPGEDAFRFRHLLLRDAAYEALPKEARAELHERFAAWLERRTGDAFEEILAYHLEQAAHYRAELGSPDAALARRAAELLVSSGRRAAGGGDKEAAGSLLGRAAALLPREDPLRLSILPELAAAQYSAGNYDAGNEIVVEAIELARAAGDERVAGRARVALLQAQLNFEPPEALEEFEREGEELVELFERLGDELGLAESLYLVAMLSWNRAHAGRAVELLERARKHARTGGTLDRELAGWLLIAAIFGPTPAAEGLELREAILAEAASPSLPALTGNAGAVFEAMLGRFEVARVSIARCLEAHEELGHNLSAAAMRGHIGGFVEELAGDLAAAESHLRTSLAELERMGEKGFLSMSAAKLGEVLYRRGRYDEAEELTVVSEEAASPDVSSQVRLRSVRAMALARRALLDDAERVAREAVELVEETDFRDEQARAYMALAEVLRLAGRPDEARQAFEEALRRHEQKGNVVSAERTRALLAELG